MPTSSATVDKKKEYSSSPSSSTPKSGRWLIISQTVLLGQIFLQLMLMGHFGPKTLAWTFIFQFWVWSFSAAIFFQRPFPFNCFSTPKPRSTFLPTFWALMGWWLQWPLFFIGLGGPPRRRQPKFFCIYPIHLMMFCFVLFFFLGRMMMLMRC